jgi:hypothetical protein
MVQRGRMWRCGGAGAGGGRAGVDGNAVGGLAGVPWLGRNSCLHVSSLGFLLDGPALINRERGSFLFAATSREACWEGTGHGRGRRQLGWVLRTPHTQIPTLAC